MIFRCFKNEIVLTVLLFCTLHLSSSSPLENDAQLPELTARVDILQTTVNQLIIKLEEEQILRANLHGEKDALEVKVDQLTSQNNQQMEQFNQIQSDFKAKIDMLMAKSAKQEEEIDYLKKLNYNSIKSSQAKNTNVDDSSKADISPRLPPSSCRQLSTIGHYLDGLYLVANPDTSKIETVYCEFGSSTLSETLYGSLDVKTKSVHFFVQRSSSFSATGAVIPFDIERLNIGGAMNLVAGTFTAPVDGIYHFDFSGLGDTNSATNNLVYLQVNGVNIAAGWSSDLPDYSFYGGLSGINASLRLKTGDQVRLYFTEGVLFDAIPYGYTQFSGWLVEEDVVLF